MRVRKHLLDVQVWQRPLMLCVLFTIRILQKFAERIVSRPKQGKIFSLLAIGYMKILLLLISLAEWLYAE